MINHDLFKSAFHSPKMCRSILVQSITWILTEFGVIPLDEPSQKGHNLAPIADVKVVHQQANSTGCT